MKAIVALVLALSAPMAANAKDCKVTGWTGGYGGAPIFNCSDQPR